MYVFPKELATGTRTTINQNSNRFDANQIQNLIQNPYFPRTATMSSPDFPEYPTLGVRASGSSVSVDITLDDFFSTFRQEISAHWIKKILTISLTDYLYSNPGIYHYSGGLTTPTCKEYVQWLVYDTPLQISKDGLVSI